VHAPTILTSLPALMHLMAKSSYKILLLPAILGSLFAIIVGCLVLFFALPSLGRQAEYGYSLSPAAGAILFVLLGLTGAIGAAIAAESRMAERGTDNARSHSFSLRTCGSCLLQ